MNTHHRARRSSPSTAIRTGPGSPVPERHAERSTTGARHPSKPRVAILCAHLLSVALLTSAVAAQPAPVIWRIPGTSAPSLPSFTNSGELATYSGQAVTLRAPLDGSVTRTFSPYNYLSVSPDGSLIALTSSDVSVRRCVDGGLVATIPGGSGGRGRFGFDGSVMFNTGPTVTVYAPPSWGLVVTAHPIPDLTLPMPSPGSPLVASITGATICMLSYPSIEPAGQIEGPLYAIQSIAWSPDGTLLASADYGPALYLWRMPDGVLSRTLLHESAVRCMAFTADSGIIWTSTGTGTATTLRAWRAADGMLLRTFSTNLGTGLTALAASRDGRFLACIQMDNAITLIADPLGPCPADIDARPGLNIGDFLTFLSLYAANNPRADLTGDGTIGLPDFVAYLNAFAAGCS
jgi:WD40 repeat protein